MYSLLINCRSRCESCRLVVSFLNTNNFRHRHSKFCHIQNVISFAKWHLKTKTNNNVSVTARILFCNFTLCFIIFLYVDNSYLCFIFVLYIYKLYSICPIRSTYLSSLSFVYLTYSSVF